jgi:hypothetical protein
MFIEEVIADVKNNKSFDKKEFSTQIKDFEEKWAEGNKKFATSPVGNTLAISKLLYKKYSDQITGTDNK